MGEGGESFAKEQNREEMEVMDTPDRSKNNQITTSISTFEDSPVFNFLNSLSPIKPVKSMHVSQTINPLTFASLPSVFTSPHVTNLKESRFLQRHQVSDPSKPEFSSDVNMVSTKKPDEQKENIDPTASNEPSYECSKLVAEFTENFNYNCSSSTHLPRNDQNKESTSSCDWENLISDASDLLGFESANDKEPCEEPVDPAINFYKNIKNAIQKVQVSSENQVGQKIEPEKLNTHHGELSEMMQNADTNELIGGTSIMNPSEKMDYENLSGLYRGMRRRCLVFEMGGGARRKENSFSDSSLLQQSNGNISNQQLVSTKTGIDSSHCVLPGIGLHLNALAASPKDYNIVNLETSASRRLLIGPSSSANFHPPTNGQELLSNSLANSSLEREIEVVENGVLPVEDAFQENGFTANEEINQSSPKKKRRRLEQAGDGESSCKRCNCKKSKCLKLYCECFAAGVYCVEPCACIDCFNKPIHEDTVLATRKQIESRNPLAFAPKVIRSSDSQPEIGDDHFSKTPASARHKRGCNCKKSGCLKKYCECYQGGVGCSINCRCEGCKNVFGRKDGSVAPHTGAELDKDSTDSIDKAISDRSLHRNDHEQNTDPMPHQTPLRTKRQLAQPFSSNKRPPRSSSFPTISSSSSDFPKTSFFPPLPKFDQHFETVMEDEIPEFLQGRSSPIGGIKLSSPNRKRVSPPKLSPGLRSSRKLILQSIPSFPSLTNNQ